MSTATSRYSGGGAGYPYPMKLDAAGTVLEADLAVPAQARGWCSSRTAAAARG
ncbi:hypothetical protein Phou_083770 [Phytohabitans houttuyneae]|uniref:Uncharacterized protein n=1 Tax=Phytohabitans houttuyneae TaxID=1076126 RepID=A0A6V8KQY6_9ACTN|nr:hypothetical protein Phou_083770 [Phytohabitans houttuyneae]